MLYIVARRLVAALLLSPPLLVQAMTMETKPFYRELWDETVGSTSSLAREGDWQLYVPARTYHMPFAYSGEQRAEQNNDPMPGIGLGRGRYLPNGNWAGVYAMGFRDSWGEPSAVAGYNYNWLWKTDDGVRYGLGTTFGLMMRSEYFGYAPFPFILPTFHLGYGRVSLEASYVPGVKKGTGNVAFFWLKIQ